MTETILSNDDIPWEVLKRRGHESVRLMELTRFYLELQKDPHGPEVGMFVGNLPANLSQRQYETLLLDLLDEGCKFSSIGPIYYEYGSMVITFDNSRASVQAYDLLKGSYHEEKKLLGKLPFQIHAGECRIVRSFSKKHLNYTDRTFTSCVDPDS